MKDKEILKRILTVVEKQVPDMWEDLKNELLKEKPIHNNENVVYDNIYFQNKRKIELRKLSIAVAACIMIVSTLAFTPAFAYIQNGIGKLLANGYHDKGVNTAMDHGIGQVINQSSANNSITVTIDGIISDQNRSAVLLSLYSEVMDLKDATIGQIDITDENDKVISNGGIMRHSYDSQNNCRRIVYSINSLNEFIGHSINVKISEINANTIKDDFISVDTGIELNNRSIYDLSTDIKDKVPFIDSFTLVKYEILNNKVDVVFEYKISEDNKDNVVFFKLFNGDGKEVEVINEKVVPLESISNNDETTVQIDENNLTYQATAEYSIESSNLLSSGIKIVAQYNNGNAVTETMEGNWISNFELDKTSTDNVSSEIKMKKDFLLNNTNYKIKYVVFSPSETRVYIIADYNSPVLETKDMMIITNSEVIKCYQFFKDQDGSQVYCFDPIIGKENVSLQISEVVKVTLID